MSSGAAAGVGELLAALRVDDDYARLDPRWRLTHDPASPAITLSVLYGLQPVGGSGRTIAREDVLRDESWS